MKRLLALTLMLAMTLGICTGCGSAPAGGGNEAAPEAAAPAESTEPEEEAGDPAADAVSGEKMTVGMACINLNDAGLILIKNGADLAGEDYDCELIWKACEGNLDTQIDQIRGFIQQGVDAIWIDSCDVAGIVDVINEATDAGIIVLTAGSKVEADANYNLIYPDYDDAYFSATVIGEYYKDQTGSVGLVVGSAGNLVSEKRQEGYTAAMKNYPNLKLVSGMGMWDATTSMTVAEDLVRSNPDMLHMHIIAAGMSYGAYQGVQNAGGNITVSTNDGDPDALDYLEKGDYLLDNVVGNERLGYWGIVIARRLFDGEAMATDQYLPTYKVMGDEMLKFVQDNGLTEINGITYKVVSIEEARKIIASESYQKEFDKDFVPTK
ncbi:MAG: sugar ABC transporter substrate-binding protein [Lachnospiraceae bacterium]|jgi:ribose transport system substrate-binding protein|nr:sugar ABC transporter substrate-binding protein [Lachnospiraceae bacterium]